MHPVCPRCDKPLIALVFRGIEIDACGQCRGLWMDAGELEDLLDCTGVVRAAGEMPLAEVPRDGSGSAKRALCPRCDRPMKPVRVSASAGVDAGPELDSCPSGHGLWFDRNELGDLLRTFPAESNAAPAIAFIEDFFGV